MTTMEFRMFSHKSGVVAARSDDLPGFVLFAKGDQEIRDRLTGAIEAYVFDTEGRRVRCMTVAPSGWADATVTSVRLQEAA